MWAAAPQTPRIPIEIRGVWGAETPPEKVASDKILRANAEKKEFGIKNKKIVFEHLRTHNNTLPGWARWREMSGGGAGNRLKPYGVPRF